MSRRRRQDLLETTLALLACFALVAVIVGVLWARASAPCSYLDWLPAGEVPARCLMR